ncbi:MAG: hypothetical protein HKN12_02000, partial [Gemmatimonadetes bacterium]|nr:hypothetical protein [Gemmatimonadota bacterium]
KSRLIIVGRPEPFGLRVDEPGRILRECTAVESPENAAPRGVSLIEAESGLIRLLDPVWLLNESREAFTELSP